MKTIVRSDCFEVREYQKADAWDVASWMSSSAYELFMVSSSLPFPLTEDIFNDYASKASSDDHKLYSLFTAGKEEDHIGHFEIKGINKRHHNGNGAHIILAPAARGKRLGHHMVSLLSHIAFSQLGLARIGLSVHTVNTSAVSAYIRAGYSVEGIVRDVLEFEGQRYSLYQMGLLRSEWEKIRHGYPVYL